MATRKTATADDNAEPTEPGAAESKGGSAEEPSVDDLLKEFDTDDDDGSGQPPAIDTRGPSKTGKDDETVTMSAREFGEFNRRIARLERENASAETREAIKTAVDTMFGAVGDSLPSGMSAQAKRELLEGRLHFRAGKDDAFRKAWANRDRNPAKFDQLLKAEAKVVATQMKGDDKDPKLTKDRQAAMAASQGQRQQEPTPDEEAFAAEIGKMSDSEFQKLMEKHGYAPSAIII